MSSSRFYGKDRLDIRELVSKVENDKLIISVDHQPKNIKEVKDSGVDIALSGHTHKGQFFPINYITGKMYDIDYGKLQKDNFTLIVSSGYGTWGPPIRLATPSEIVKIKVKKD